MMMVMIGVARSVPPVFLKLVPLLLQMSCEAVGVIGLFAPVQGSVVVGDQRGWVGGMAQSTLPLRQAAGGWPR